MQQARSNLVAQDVALEGLRNLRALVERIERRDRTLADQLRRAASSVVLNLAEGAHHHAGNRRMRFEAARGSASEVRAALAVACAWGYVTEEDATEIDVLYDRVLAMTYRLWRAAR